MNWNSLIALIHTIINTVVDLSKRYGLKVISLIIFIIVCISIIGYYFSYKTTKTIENVITQYELDKSAKHRQLYYSSIKSYSNIKSILKKNYNSIGASHILYLEYHNGGENIATGYQFSKFDILMEITNPDNTYIRIDDYKDENILHYDILLNDQVLHHRIIEFPITDIKILDHNFYRILEPAKSDKIIICNLFNNRIIAGTVIFLFKADAQINQIAIINTIDQIEKILTTKLNADI